MKPSSSSGGANSANILAASSEEENWLVCNIKKNYALPHNLSKNGTYGMKPSSSSGGANSANISAASSFGTSSARLHKMFSSSANIMVPFSFLSYNLHNST